MSKVVFQEELGGSTTIQAQDTADTFTLQLPAADGTLVHSDAGGTATFDNLSLTGAVIAGAWDADTIDVEHGGTGATTLTGYVIASGTSPMTASATIPSTNITGLGTMSVQNANAVAITGGTADGLTVGAVTPAAAIVTTLRVNSTVSLAGDTGTTGQVLTSNGGSAPTWENIAGSGTVTSVDVSGGTTGLTTSGGPVTGAGTITLAGTLAVANGGTGSTTAGDALTSLGAYPASNPSGFTSNTGTVTDVTGSAPIASSGGTTPAISISQATTSTDGYLSSTDWNTFNNKTSNTGTVTSVGGTGTVNGLTLTGTVTTSGDLTLGGTLDLSSPPAIGGTAAAAGTFTTLADSAGDVRSIPQSGSAKTTSYTLATTDNGQFIEVGASGSITIPDATFATGNAVSIFNNTSGDITITCTITTAYLAGTDEDKATVTLATRGVATLLFISGTVCVISGNVT
jgi:hypothetical protein